MRTEPIVNLDLIDNTPDLSGDLLCETSGRVKQATGAIIKVTGKYSIGQICRIVSETGHDTLAEVVGFDENLAILTPFGPIGGISPNSSVYLHSQSFEVPVGYGTCGCVLDALGNAVAQSPQPITTTYRSTNAKPPDPMSRPVISDPISLGVRSIDGLLTCGVGQRVGIFAAAGVGKSVLLSTLVRQAEYDQCVICLIGERGREVREFLEHNLDPEARKNCVTVIATSDRPAIEQVNAAYTATTIAEYFREQGSKVLLLVDSLTRFARAQRQIGLSAGEPPTRRGYPPSVFERLPGLLERTGNSADGSITAFYTVLLEGDDVDEPVADEVRSLLDGHIILSRELASEGHYPAIDIASSASRLFQSVTTEEHQKNAMKFRSLLNSYKEIELLLRVGEYVTGSDPLADLAIAKRSAMLDFLQQGAKERSNYTETLFALDGLVNG